MFPNDSLIQGLEFLKGGELLKARTYFEDLIQKTPTNPNAWHLLGVVLFHSGLYQDAIQFFNKAVELDDGRQGERDTGKQGSNSFICEYKRGR